jgi:hypothetical protein
MIILRFVLFIIACSVLHIPPDELYNELLPHIDKTLATIITTLTYIVSIAVFLYIGDFLAGDLLRDRSKGE